MSPTKGTKGGSIVSILRMSEGKWQWVNSNEFFSSRRGGDGKSLSKIGWAREGLS